MSKPNESDINLTHFSIGQEKQSKLIKGLLLSSQDGEREKLITWRSSISLLDSCIIILTCFILSAPIHIANSSIQPYGHSTIGQKNLVFSGIPKNYQGDIAHLVYFSTMEKNGSNFLFDPWKILIQFQEPRSEVHGVMKCGARRNGRMTLSIPVSVICGQSIYSSLLLPILMNPITGFTQISFRSGRSIKSQRRDYIPEISLILFTERLTTIKIIFPQDISKECPQRLIRRCLNDSFSRSGLVLVKGRCFINSPAKRMYQKLYCSMSNPYRSWFHLISTSIRCAGVFGSNTKSNCGVSIKSWLKETRTQNYVAGNYSTVIHKQKELNGLVMQAENTMTQEARTPIMTSLGNLAGDKGLNYRCMFRCQIHRSETVQTLSMSGLKMQTVRSTFYLTVRNVQMLFSASKVLTINPVQTKKTIQKIRIRITA